MSHCHIRAPQAWCIREAIARSTMQFDSEHNQQREQRGKTSKSTWKEKQSQTGSVGTSLQTPVWVQNSVSTGWQPPQYILQTSDSFMLSWAPAAKKVRWDKKPSSRSTSTTSDPNLQWTQNILHPTAIKWWLTNGGENTELRTFSVKGWTANTSNEGCSERSQHFSPYPEKTQKPDEQSHFSLAQLWAKWLLVNSL